MLKNEYLEYITVPGTVHTVARAGLPPPRVTLFVVQVKVHDQKRITSRGGGGSGGGGSGGGANDNHVQRTLSLVQEHCYICWEPTMTVSNCECGIPVHLECANNLPDIMTCTVCRTPFGSRENSSP